MRQVDSLRQAWQDFLRHDSLDDLRNAVRADDSHAAPIELRSAYWKAFLFFESDHRQTWAASLAAARSAYDALHSRFNAPPVAVALAEDPLAEGIENHWLAKQEDDNLRAEILQDIVRLPDDDYLRNPKTQNILLSILFVFCKLNPDLSYRQGMHELLAPILTVLERDALDVGTHDNLGPEDSLPATLFDASFIEHDAFTLFSRVMQSAKNFYEHTSHRAADNPLILRSKRITQDLLSQADPHLARHLERINIPPQLYLMRWLRLLFGREFDRQDVLSMWDIIFAEDVTMDLVDYICVVMLLRIRWDLLSAEYDTSLSLLLRYSAGETHAQGLAIDAIHLRDRLTPSTGRRLIAKYTGRLPTDNRRRSGTPPAMQRNITTFSGVNALKSAWRGAVDPSKEREDGEQQSNLEALLQNTARNIFERSEQLGIGKAVRTAVDDIHRRAQKLRDIDGPMSSPPQVRSPRAARSAQVRLSELEKRNKQLAKMLEHATECLWEVQKHLAESEIAIPDDSAKRPAVDLEELSIAVGKVQFVQLHLQDSTLKLSNLDASQDEGNQHVDSSKASLDDPVSQQVPSANSREGSNLTSPNSAMQQARDETNTRQVNSSQTTEEHEHASEERNSRVTEVPSKESDSLQPTRPPLAESAYSWMLGQQEVSKPFVRRERPDTLFGS